MTRTARAKPTGQSPAAVGLKVLAALARGRQKINQARQEQAGFWRRIILEYALLDAQAGHPPRGRAGRIARKLKGRLSQRWINKVLVALSCATRDQRQSGGRQHLPPRRNWK